MYSSSCNMHGVCRHSNWYHSRWKASGPGGAASVSVVRTTNERETADSTSTEPPARLGWRSALGRAVSGAWTARQHPLHHHLVLVGRKLDLVRAVGAPRPAAAP